MQDITENSKKVHQGRNVKRFREMLGIKQEALAMDLGLEWTQKKISVLESKEVINANILKQVAEILKVPVESIENFSEEAMVNYFNIFNDHSVNQGAVYAFNSTFNPIEKLVEVFEENKKLYERLLASEKEKVEILRNKL
jgi:transcriptional regulator with XRE-family HTH domain